MQRQWEGESDEEMRDYFRGLRGQAAGNNVYIVLGLIALITTLLYLFL